MNDNVIKKKPTIKKECMNIGYIFILLTLQSLGILSYFCVILLFCSISRILNVLICFCVYSFLHNYKFLLFSSKGKTRDKISLGNSMMYSANIRTRFIEILVPIVQLQIEVDCTDGMTLFLHTISCNTFKTRYSHALLQDFPIAALYGPSPVVFKC